MLPRRSPIASLRPPSPVREAATEFIRGTTLGWGRRDLASWLVCHYSPCLVTDDVRTRGQSCFASLSRASTRLDEESVERVILDARSSVLRLLAALASSSQAAAAARNAIGSGFVIARRDSQGDLRWAPVGRQRMRLADRVGSLFIADALANPRDYRGVSLCRYCGELGFGMRSAHQSWCEHARHVA
jgi:hypothetical protein